MSTKVKIRKDVYIGALLIIFSLFFLWQTMKIEKINSSAAIFPKIALSLMLFFSIIIFILGIKNTLKPQNSSQDLEIDWKVCKNPLTVAFITMLYLVLFNYIGFFFASAIYIPILMLFYGIRSIKTIIITDISLNLFIYFLFVIVLKFYIS